MSVEKVDEMLSNTNLGKGDDSAVGTWLTKVGPEGKDFIPEWLEVELWDIENDYQEAKKLKTIRFIRSDSA